MHKINELKKQLQKLGLENEAKYLRLLSLAVMGPSQSRVDYYQGKGTDAPKSDTSFVESEEIEAFHVLFDMLGLVPGYGEIADLANASLYLAKGPSNENLFYAGVSIISMISGLGDVTKVLKYATKIDVLYPIAKKLLNNWENIRAVFTRLRSPEVKKRLTHLIPNGELIVKYNEQILKTVHHWAEQIVANVAKEGLDSIRKSTP